ncbi:MAG: TIGR04076 family protein [Candidatus Thorarchaeota archaeon]
MYKVIAKVDELRTEPGHSPCPLFQLNQEFDLSVPEERAKICKWAVNSFFPGEIALEFGARIPFGDNPDRIKIACPDSNRIVVFELRRAEKIPARESGD